MSYTRDKPDSGPSPALDAPTILTNFSQFGTLFNANHTALNNSNQGDHEKVIMEMQSADPGVNQTLGILYALNATATTGGTQPQLFLQIPKFLPTSLDPVSPEQAANVGMQLTFSQVNTGGPIFQSFLPGGYLLYIGSITQASGALPFTVTVTPSCTKLLMAIAAPTAIIATPSGNQAIDVETVITGANTFVISSAFRGQPTPASWKFNWIAIGKA